MQRRKFLATMGSLAAGSAAAMGTGAFTSVEANRAVSVNVANDANAYLALTAPDTLENGEYAKTSGGTLSLNFDASAGIVGSGNGVNANAITTFDEVFKIKNQGNRHVDIRLDKSGLANPSRWQFAPRGFISDEVFNASWNDGEKDQDPFYPSWDDYQGKTWSGGGLDVGQSKAVSVAIDTRGIDSLGGGNVTFVAIDPNSEGATGETARTD